VLAVLLEEEASPNEGPSLLLTRRSHKLRNHAGQISFPGGTQDETDGDLLQTALRETREEVGLDPALVRIEGRLSPVPTPTGYLIVPFVARMRGRWRPEVVSPGEVHSVLTPELTTFTEPGVYFSQGSALWRGHEYEMHAYRIADPPLWGATARMFWELLGHLELR